MRRSQPRALDSRSASYRRDCCARQQAALSFKKGSGGRVGPAVELMVLGVVLWHATGDRTAVVLCCGAWCSPAVDYGAWLLSALLAPGCLCWCCYTDTQQ